MNWKVFILELIRPIYPTILIILTIFGYAYLVISHYTIAVTVALIPLIMALVTLLFIYWIEPAYKKAKQAKPKCHWKIKWPRYNGDDTAIFQTECNETISGIREKCKCGKEVVVDLW